MINLKLIETNNFLAEYFSSFRWQYFPGINKPAVVSDKKNWQFQFPDFSCLERTKSGILIKKEGVLKTFSIISIAFQTIYLIIFKIFNLYPTTGFALLPLLLPLVFSVFILSLISRKMNTQAIALITWILPALLAWASIMVPGINYSKILLICSPLVYLLNTSGWKKIVGFAYLAIAHSFIQFHYTHCIVQTEFSYHSIAEVYTLPLFYAVLFVILHWIQQEFNKFSSEIALQKESLEQKNIALENLVSFTEAQRDKLKRTVLLKEKLLSIVSHDVRVPLNAFKFLIENYEKGRIPKEYFLDGIVEAKKDIVKMDNMVVDLLNWSKTSQSNRIDKLINAQEINDAMESLISLYGLCAKNKSLQIATEVFIPENANLSIPVREINIILRNLVSNAIKFSNTGNKINVSLSMLSNGPSKVAQLKVEDFGTGMYPSVLENLTSTQLLSSNGTLNEVGIGIGLSIVFDVINSYGLDYEIKSEVNKGTAFYINIPVIIS